MDLTEAEFVETAPGFEPKKKILTILAPENNETIFNVIIMEKDKENTEGKQ